MLFGVLLIGIGIVALAVQLDILPSSIASLVWPMLAIFVGVWLLMGKRHPRTCTCWSCSTFGWPQKKNGR
jgi:drug/metabolite transporter (DMT)-like permease